MRRLSPPLQASVERVAKQIAQEIVDEARREGGGSRVADVVRRRLPTVARAAPTAVPAVGRRVAGVLGRRATPPVPQGGQAVQLLLEAQTLTCLEDSREVGADEIALAAFFVDLEDNVVLASDAVDLGEFRKSDVKPLNLGALAHTVRSNQTFPRAYLGVLCLAERDRGGFEDFLAEVLAALVAELDAPDPVGKGQKVYNKGLIVALVLAGAGVATLPVEPLSLALMIASAISFVITAIAALVAGAVGDELFPVVTETLVIEAFGQPLAGGTVDPFNVTFERSHAKYTLAGQFRVQV